MAHEVDMSNGRANMAFIGETPWHGLGQQLTPDSPIETWCQEAGMDWRIESTPVLYLSGDEVECFPDRAVLTRSDNHAPLSIVSDSYKIVHPNEILEFYRDLVAAGDFQLETAGCLFGGRKFWALANTKHEVKIGDRDLLKGYLLLATSCDASLATTARFTSVRVVCNNTLTAATHDNSGIVKVPHNSRFQADIIKQDLLHLGTVWEDFSQRVDTLAKREISDKEALEFMIKLMGDEEKELDKQPEAISNILRLFKGQGKGSEFASSKGTAWGLVNAITEHVDHHQPTKDGNINNRLDRAWFGIGNKLKDNAFALALDLAA